MVSNRTAFILCRRGPRLYKDYRKPVLRQLSKARTSIIGVIHTTFQLTIDYPAIQIHMLMGYEP